MELDVMPEVVCINQSQACGYFFYILVIFSPTQLVPSVRLLGTDLIR